MTAIPAELPMRRYAADAHPSLAEEWRDIAEHSHLLYSLVHRDLTVRYKRSVIGFFWTMLNPLLMMTIFVIVFSAVFRFQITHYETYFLSAYLPWNFFAQTTVGAMASMAWNGALMKRVRVPKSIFTLATTISGVVNLLLSFIPLLLIMAILGAPIRLSILFLPVSVIILAVFTFGVSLMLAAISVYFFDIREMYNVAVAALMYLTPIMYPLTIVPAKFRPIMVFNPLTHLMSIIRDPIYAGRIPAGSELLITSGLALFALIVGWEVFRRLSRGFYPHL